MPLPLQFAIAVILGVLIATAIAAAYVKWNARVSAGANARRAGRDRPPRAGAPAAARRAERRAPPPNASASPPKRSDARIERLRESSASPRNHGAPRSAMPSAWSAPSRPSYRKPPGCAGGRALECANHYIRASAASRRSTRAEQARQRAALFQVLPLRGMGQPPAPEESVASASMPSRRQHPMARLASAVTVKRSMRCGACWPRRPGRARFPEIEEDRHSGISQLLGMTRRHRLAAAARRRPARSASMRRRAGFGLVCSDLRRSRPRLLPRRHAGRSAFRRQPHAAQHLHQHQQADHGKTASHHAKTAAHERAAAPAAVAAAATTGATQKPGAAGSEVLGANSLAARPAARPPSHRRSGLEVVPA